MKNRLDRIFDPMTGRTVILANDHGYFQGLTLYETVKAAQTPKVKDRGHAWSAHLGSALKPRALVFKPSYQESRVAPEIANSQ